MRQLDILEHIQHREYDCPCCYQRFCAITERFDHVLQSHARDFDEAVELLTAAMMPLFDTHHVSGPDGVEYIGVTHDDYLALLCNDGDPVAQAYQGDR